VTSDVRPNKPTSGAEADPDSCPQYEIRVAGRLGSRWAAWFDGLILSTDDDGTTVIRGSVPDQAALHGLLHKVRDIGIPLISLTRLPAEIPAERPALRTQTSPHDSTGATP
jgi:hypothetical protein